MSSAVVVGEIVFDAAGKPIDCRIIDANSAFARLIGRGADQLVGRLLSEVRPGLWPDLLDRAGRVATSGQPEEFEQRDAKSDRSSLIRLSRVGSASLMATIEDTTDAHRAEAVLDRNAFIESIIASTGDGLVVFDRDLRMSVWNTAIEEITGWTADQILGRKPRDVFREEIAGRLEEIVAGIIASSSLMASRAVGRGGHGRWAGHIATPADRWSESSHPFGISPPGAESRISSGRRQASSRSSSRPYRVPSSRRTETVA